MTLIGFFGNSLYAGMRTSCSIPPFASAQCLAEHMKTRISAQTNTTSVEKPSGSRFPDEKQNQTDTSTRNDTTKALSRKVGVRGEYVLSVAPQQKQEQPRQELSASPRVAIGGAIMAIGERDVWWAKKYEEFAQKRTADVVAEKPAEREVERREELLSTPLLDYQTTTACTQNPSREFVEKFKSQLLLAAYDETSTKETPVIHVEIAEKGKGVKAWNVDVKAIDPANATLVEMYALSTHLAAQGEGYPISGYSGNSNEVFFESTLESLGLSDCAKDSRTSIRAVDPHERLDWTTITPFADMALPELTTVPFAPNSQSSMPYAWAEVEPGATTAADSASTDAARQSTLLLGSQAFRRLSLESLELLSTDQKANADKDERETTEVLNGPFGNTVYSGWISHQSRMQIEL